MELRGKAHKLGDNINTDLIISGKYKFKTLNMEELRTHLFEDIDKDFYKKIIPGDFLVGGVNFGCGSSREQAPLVIKEASISAVLASSFARIFYRNAINIGLVLIECDTRGIEDKDELIIDLEERRITNRTKAYVLEMNPLPTFMINILNSGGLVEYIKRNKGWNLLLKES